MRMGGTTNVSKANITRRPRLNHHIVTYKQKQNKISSVHSLGSSHAHQPPHDAS